MGVSLRGRRGCARAVLDEDGARAPLADAHPAHPSALVGLLPAGLAGPPVNIFRASLHPDGLAAHTVNFDDWASYLLGQLHRLVTVTADHGLAQLECEMTSYPNVAALAERRDWTTPTDEPALLIPFRLRRDDVELSLFTTLTTFGTPRDITLDELAVELFFPADDDSDAALRRLQPTSAPDSEEHR